MVDLHLEFEFIDLGSHLETLSLPVCSHDVHISGLGVLSDVPSCATRGHNVGDIRHHLINVHPAANNSDFLSHALDLLVQVPREVDEDLLQEIETLIRALYGLYHLINVRLDQFQLGIPISRLPRKIFIDQLLIGPEKLFLQNAIFNPLNRSHGTLEFIDQSLIGLVSRHVYDSNVPLWLIILINSRDINDSDGSTICSL
jgi:hypothetical protein